MSNLMNLRDLGGYKAADGKIVKPGWLFRSNHLMGLTEEDFNKLEAIAGGRELIIVDFRRPRELKEVPNDDVKDAVFINLDVISDADNGIIVKLQDFLEYATARLAEERMHSIYKSFIHMQSATKSFAEFLRICTKGERTILFHCHHGKDRTGFAAMLLLKILGVSDEDIYDDYLKTLAGGAKMKEEILKAYQGKGFDGERMEAAAVLNSVKREYLETSFKTIEAEYGSFENYIKLGLGITDEEIKKLKELYLE